MVLIMVEEVLVVVKDVLVVEVVVVMEVEVVMVNHQHQSPRKTTRKTEFSNIH